MIPSNYRDHPCYGLSMGDPKTRAEHRGHQSAVECFLLTWDEAPLPWVKRPSKQNGTARRPRGSPTGTRSWHLATGIRKDTGHVQTSCMVGDGPGPFIWREQPVLDWREEPGENFCQRCVAHWTEEILNVTVRTEPIRVTRKQLEGLLAEMPTADLAVVELRPTAIEDAPALIAEWPSGERNDDTKVRYLLVGNGVVKL